MISLVGLAMIFLWVCLSMRKNRNLPRRHAAQRLLEVFQDEIRGLNYGQEDVSELLARARPRHEKAYLEFRSYLKGKELREFDRAWLEYSSWIKEKPKTILAEIFPEGSATVVYERRQLCLDGISEFLSVPRKYSNLPPVEISETRTVSSTREGAPFFYPLSAEEIGKPRLGLIRISYASEETDRKLTPP